MRTITSFSFGALVLGLGGIASANTFENSFHDAKAIGRGNASTATDTDPSAITYNIGGLAADEGTNVMIGGIVAFPSASFTDTGGTKFKGDAGTPVVPHIYLSSRINDLLAVGLGFHVPFGGDIDWPDAAPVNDVAKKNSIRSYFITPSVGVNLGKYVPGLTLGAGVDLVPATIEITQFIFFGGTQGQAHLGGNAFGVGGRAGAMYKPEALPELSVGVMWRSQVNEDFTGKGDFDIAEPFRGQLPPDGDISLKIKLPQSVLAGVAYRPMPELEIEADTLWQDWSKYKEVRVHLPNMTDSVNVENYKNTFSFNAGAEYKLTQYKAAVRAGYSYDPTPIPNTTLDSEVPDANRHIVSAGGSYSFDDYDLHLGLSYLIPVSMNTSTVMFTPLHKGKYEIQAFIAALTVGGHFGR
jgi:long-chain fatty acid transport protein